MIIINFEPTTDIHIDPLSTNNIEAYFKALFVVQTTPGCETETASLTKKLQTEFKHIPETTIKGETYKKFETIRYHPNGKVVIIKNKNEEYGYVMLEPYSSEEQIAKAKKVEAKRIANEKTKIEADIKGVKPRKKNITFTYIKHLNPIWYAQVMHYVKRKVVILNKNKINYRALAKQYAIYENLSDEDKKGLDINDLKTNLELDAYKITELFTIDYNHINTRPRLHVPYKKKGISINRLPSSDKDFFYLNDAECKSLAEAIIADDIGGARHQAYDKDTSTFKQTLVNIVTAKSKDRVYIRDVMFKDIKYNNRYYYEDHKKIWNAYTAQHTNLNENQEYIAQLFGIIPEKNNDVEGITKK